MTPRTHCVSEAKKPQKTYATALIVATAICKLASNRKEVVFVHDLLQFVYEAMRGAQSSMPALPPAWGDVAGPVRVLARSQWSNAAAKQTENRKASSATPGPDGDDEFESDGKRARHDVSAPFVVPVPGRPSQLRKRSCIEPKSGSDASTCSMCSKKSHTRRSCPFLADKGIILANASDFQRLPGLTGDDADEMLTSLPPLEVERRKGIYETVPSDVRLVQVFQLCNAATHGLVYVANVWSASSFDHSSPQAAEMIFCASAMHRYIKTVGSGKSRVLAMAHELGDAMRSRMREGRV